MSKNKTFENCVQICDYQQRVVWLYLSTLNSEKYIDFMQNIKDTQMIFQDSEQNQENIFLGDVQKMQLQCKLDAFNNKKWLQQKKMTPATKIYHEKIESAT